jgi:hypothetical protein
MPYFVYRIETVGPVRRLHAAGAFDAYAGASAECRRLRAIEGAAGLAVKMVFAQNALQAEELLSEIRPPGPLIGDDY